MLLVKRRKGGQIDALFLVCAQTGHHVLSSGQFFLASFRRVNGAGTSTCHTHWTAWPWGGLADADVGRKLRTAPQP